MINAQEWLDSNYPKEERSKITKLDISSKNLQDSLDLSDFVNLEELNCSNNNINFLNLGDCSGLENLSCQINCLDQLNFLNNLNPEKLIHVNMGGNNFPPQDIEIFSRFKKLHTLLIGTDQEERIEKDIYNRFYGSLEAFRNMKELEWVHIQATDVDKGWEYLPIAKLKGFYCLPIRKDAKVKKIYELFGGDDINDRSRGIYLISKFKFLQNEWRSRSEQIQILQKQIQTLSQEKKEREPLKQSSSLKNQQPILSEQSDQLLKDLTQKTHQATQLQKATLDFQDQIWNKTTQLETNPSSELENEIENLKQQLAEKETQLAKKEQELAELQAQNEKIIKQYHSYLEIIGKFKEKQGELKELKQSYLGNELTEETWNKINGLQASFTRLEIELERIIDEQLDKGNSFIEELKQKQVERRLRTDESVEDEKLDKLKYQLNTGLQQSILTEVKNFLRVKEIFFNTRQGTIKRCRDCYNKLSKTVNRTLVNTSSAGEIIGKAGEGIGGLETLGIPKLIGGLTVWLSKFSEGSFSDKRLEEFRRYLNIDERHLSLLNEKYNSLIKIIRENKEISSEIIEILKLEDKLEDTKIKGFDVDSGWKQYLTLEKTFEEMDEIMNKLDDSHRELKSELEDEKKQFEQKFDNSFSEEKNPAELQKLINYKQTILENLITSTKEKLKSKSTFSFKSKEREEKLESFFKNFPTNQDEFIKNLENIKKDLSKKLTLEEISDFCQTKTELENLQQSQLQTQILQPPKNS